MKRQPRKQGTVLIYTLVLVILSLIMAMVILSIASLLASNSEMQEITRKLSSNVLSKGKLSLKYAKIVNSNGSGFIDTIGCPNSVTMSGGTLFSSTGTVFSYSDGDFFCLGQHNGNQYKIFSYSGAYNDTYAEYLGDEVDIISGIPERNFLDTDNTRMTFNISSTAYSDGIDDDFNNDDYTIYATGTTLYPGGYVDDDADARKLIYGYANPGVGFVNMMWNNTQTNQYIDSNPLNTDPITEKIGSMTSSGVMLLDMNQDYQLRLYRLDRGVYDATKEILPLDIYESTNNLGGVGYLQNNAGILELSPTKTGNEFEFDFVNNDYAIFVRNNGTGALLYTLHVETLTGTGVYINPIDDSDASMIKVLSNDIIIDNEGRFLYEEFEVIDVK